MNNEDWQQIGIDLLTREGPDGPDWMRVCFFHEWLSLSAADAENTGHCPHCYAAMTSMQGHRRFLRHFDDMKDLFPCHH